MQVFAFSVTDTVPEIMLERVTVALSPSEPDAYRHVVTLGCPRIREGNPGTIYAAFARNPEAGFGEVSFDVELRFNSRECDPSHNYEAVGDPVPETYPVDAVVVTAADFVARNPVGDFRTAWENLGAGNEVKEDYTLSFKSVSEAFTTLIDTLGLVPCENTGTMKAGATTHTAVLAGTFLGGVPVLSKLLLTLKAEGQCDLKILIRSQVKQVAELVMSTIG